MNLHYHKNYCHFKFYFALGKDHIYMNMQPDLYIYMKYMYLYIIYVSCKKRKQTYIFSLTCKKYSEEIDPMSLFVW